LLINYLFLFYQKTAEMAINCGDLAPNKVRFPIGVRIFFLELSKNMRRFGLPKRLTILLPLQDTFRTIDWHKIQQELNIFNFLNIGKLTVE